MTDHARLTAALFYALQMHKQTNEFQMCSDMATHLQKEIGVRLPRQEATKAGRRAPAEKRQHAN